MKYFPDTSHTTGHALLVAGRGQQLLTWQLLKMHSGTYFSFDFFVMTFIFFWWPCLYFPDT